MTALFQSQVFVIVPVSLDDAAPVQLNSWKVKGRFNETKELIYCRTWLCESVEGLGDNCGPI